MDTQATDIKQLKILQRARNAVLELGYSKLTMTALADACGLSRRALYHHFKDKEEIFRAIMRLGNQEAFDAGDWTVKIVMAKGGSALDVIAGWLDTRFGNTRRSIGRSAHGQELNALAFRIGSDIMIEVSQESNTRLAHLITDLGARGLLTLRSGMTAQDAATLVADGARGVNQARPPIPNGKIAARYRQMAEAILYGCAQPPSQQDSPHPQ
jgi:AcrR family transcriptional regulator